MIKVTFKDEEGVPCKVVKRYNQGEATTVTLKGKMKYPDYWLMIPKDIWKWVSNHPIIDNDSPWSIHIRVQGKARRSPKDEDNPQLAERIAEARAKIKLYRFLYILSNKVCTYLESLLVGPHTKGIYRYTSSNEGIMADRAKYKRLWNAEATHLKKLLKSS